MDQQRFAGFWRRVLAYMIDSVLLGLVGLVLFLPALGLLGMNIALEESEAFHQIDGMEIAIILSFLFGIVTVTLAKWLYYAVMESSSRGATIGKLVLGLRVTNLKGGRVSFGRATGRYFAKYLSGGTLGLGYLMAAFTQQKQALHDIVAGCLVVLGREANAKEDPHGVIDPESEGITR